MPVYKKRSNNSNVLRKKAVVIGDGACGKTCLLHVFRLGKFPEDQRYIPTIFDTWVADLEVDGHSVEFALWDTAGQEEFDSLRLLCYPDADVIIMCYSADSPDSLENIKDRWFGEVQEYASQAPIVLVGLKQDLQNDPATRAMLRDVNQTPVTSQQGHEMANTIGAVSFIECSSKLNLNVQRVFEIASHNSLVDNFSNRNTAAGWGSGCCVIL